MRHPPLFSVHTVYLTTANSAERLSNDPTHIPTLLETFQSREDRAEFLRSIVEDVTGTTSLQITELQAVSVLQGLLGPMIVTLYDSEWDEVRNMYRSVPPGFLTPAMAATGQPAVHTADRTEW